MTTIRPPTLFGVRRIGLRLRFTFYGALLATATVILLTTLSYVNLRGGIIRQEHARLEEIARDIAVQVEGAFATLHRDVAGLSRNSLLVAGLVDSAGREAYLKPFLAEHQLSGGFEYNLVLTDFRGEPLAARKALHAYGAAPWFRAVIEQGRQWTAIDRSQGRPILRLAYPVEYGYTRTREGVLVFEADLRTWLEGKHAPFAISGSPNHVEFRLDGASIALPVERDRSESHATEAIRALRPEGLEFEGRLDVFVASHMDVLLAPLRELLWRHVLWGGLAILLVAAASGALARRQVRRIELLAAEAARAAESGNAVRYLGGRFGDDEIGDLARSLGQLFEELGEQKHRLESLVTLRTAELAAREADLLHAQAIARIGSWRFDATTDTFTCSAEARQVLGFRPEAGIVYGDFLARFHPDEREEVERVLADSGAGASSTREYRIVIGDSVFWVVLCSEALVDTSGRSIGWIGTIQDVTERRTAEDNLRRLSAAVEQGSALIVITDAAGSIQYVNPQFEKVTGFTAEEVFGKNPRLWKSSRLLPFEYGTLWATISKGQVWHGEFENRCRDGSTYWALASISPILDDCGRISGYVAVEEDVSARKALERVTREREARLSALIEAMSDQVLVVDRRGLIRAFHAPGATFAKLPAMSAIGRHYDEILPEEIARRFGEIFAEVDADGRSRQFDYTLRTATELRNFNASISRVEDEQGEADGHVVVARDVTERRQVERALAKSEARYRTLFGDLRVVLLLIDPESGRIIDANAAAVAYYGYDVDALREMSITRINTLAPEQVRAEMELARLEKRNHFSFRHRLASGEIRDVEVASGPIEIEGRTLLVSAVVDVTERLRSEARMRQALVVFNASAQGIMTTDAAGVITSVNPAFCQITGYSPEQAIGQRPSILKSNRHDAEFYRGLWVELVAAGRWEGEIWNRRRNGEIYPQWLTITAVRDHAGLVVEYVALFSDITKRKEQDEAIWRQANFDALTGLANRSLLHDRLERALAQARRNGRKVGLVFVDLDGFKWINDTLGHDVGDELLVEVARRLLGCVREQDTVARMGGDEFTLVIHDLADAEALSSVGEKAVNVLQQPYTLAGAEQHLSGSVGITVFPDDGFDVQTLLRNADIAMYKSKQTGKNRYHFYDRAMQADAQARVQMEAALREAIAASAFVLHYQPIVDADSGELVCAEALIRWRDPKRGLVSPQDFIPVAEECGLIVDIGEWALREAARQWREWQRAGFPALRIAVNISAVQFREAGLPELVAQVLREYEVDRGSLVLEITESVLMDGSDAAEARMAEIKALGAGYSLDDFGTGFSSLSYLKRFPVDVVKVDRSFVRDCIDDRNDARLVEAIVNMAHSLDLAVTAEGVETAAQVDFLRDLGCDFLQGYLISRPVPADEFETLMRQRQILPPGESASLEESRFLAALRQDEVDVDVWLRRLLGERSPALASFLESRGWVSHDIDLRQALAAHLGWRRRLNDYVGGRLAASTLDADEAGASCRCELGRWIEAGQPEFGERLRELDAAHREFHQLAGQIVADFNQGYRDSARRALAGIVFRTASRKVVTALIDLFQKVGEEVG